MAEYLNYDALITKQILEFVTLIRCSECEWFKNDECTNIHGLIHASPYAFCSFGERRKYHDIHRVDK